MSRLRTTLASTETDKEIQRHLDLALREVEAAVRIASQLPVQSYQKRRVHRDLGHVMDALQAVRHAGEPSTDPDAISEVERNRQYREQLAQERRATRERSMTHDG